MTFEIAAFLVLFVVALVLFAVEWFSADVTALGLMIALILLGLLEPNEAFAGFGSQTVLMILGLLILTETLNHTGLVDMLGQWLIDFVGTKSGRIRAILLVAPALLSSLISNTAATAFFLPIVMSLSKRSQISASKLLMPMAFATIIAGSLTLIGTSTNLVVSGLMQEYGLAPLSMFELTPVGIVILSVGLLYMGLIGYRLIPDRTSDAQTYTRLNNDLYFTEITIPNHSRLIGQTIDSSGLIHQLKLGMLQLQRGNELLKPLADMVLQAGDILIVEGSRDAMLRLPTSSGFEVSGKIQALDDYLKDGGIRVAEVIVLPDSPLVGRTIKGLGLRDRYQVQILAVNQTGNLRHSKIGRLTFGVGDMLLIKVPQRNLDPLQRERYFGTLDIIDNVLIDKKQVIRATLIFAGTLFLGIAGIIPIAVATLLGALMMFLFRCITPDIAYNNIQWRTLILIASMLAFGKAMQETGASDFLADMIVSLPGMNSPTVLLSVFFFTGLIITQPMSNQVAAAVLLPVAVQTALTLGYNPRPFAVMVAIVASCSFITPLEPACMIIYGAGRYKFTDFVRVGGILTFIVYIIAISLIPLIWEI